MQFFTLPSSSLSIRSGSKLKYSELCMKANSQEILFKVLFLLNGRTVSFA
jgi:hypothetical protein